MVFAAQVDSGERHLAGLLGVQLALARRAAFDGLAAPAKPQTARGGHGIAQGHSQAAGGALAWVGHAVGYDNESAHVILSP